MSLVDAYKKLPLLIQAGIPLTISGLLLVACGGDFAEVPSSVTQDDEDGDGLLNAFDDNPTIPLTISSEALDSILENVDDLNGFTREDGQTYTTTDLISYMQDETGHVYSKTKDSDGDGMVTGLELILGNKSSIANNEIVYVQDGIDLEELSYEDDNTDIEEGVDISENGTSFDVSDKVREIFSEEEILALEEGVNDAFNLYTDLGLIPEDKINVILLEEAEDAALHEEADPVARTIGRNTIAINPNHYDLIQEIGNIDSMKHMRFHEAGHLAADEDTHAPQFEIPGFIANERHVIFDEFKGFGVKYHFSDLEEERGNGAMDESLVEYITAANLIDPVGSLEYGKGVVLLNKIIAEVGFTYEDLMNLYELDRPDMFTARIMYELNKADYIDEASYNDERYVSLFIIGEIFDNVVYGDLSPEDGFQQIMDNRSSHVTQ